MMKIPTEKEKKKIFKKEEKSQEINSSFLFALESQKLIKNFKISNLKIQKKNPTKKNIKKKIFIEE